MNQCTTCNKETINPKYCSRSCAATFNNSLKPKRKRKPRGFCLQCSKELIRSQPKNPNHGKYCSVKCARKYERCSRVKSGEAGIRALKTHMQIELSMSSCSICTIAEWNNKQIVLELDHIDGNPENNSLINLRLLCPNCHSQTPTYKNRNMGNGRHSRRMRYSQGKSY